MDLLIRDALEATDLPGFECSYKAVIEDSYIRSSLSVTLTWFRGSRIRVTTLFRRG
jgi:hypothetical protein